MENLTPDLFHIDYGRLLETLVTIIVFSFFIERALSVIFESRLFINWAEETSEPTPPKISISVEPEMTSPKTGITGEPNQVIVAGHPKKKGIRELISILVSIGFCIVIGFDAITIILQSSNKMTYWGMVLSGLIIAGGSKASIALFQNVMGVMSSAEKARKELKKQTA